MIDPIQQIEARFDEYQMLLKDTHLHDDWFITHVLDFRNLLKLVREYEDEIRGLHYFGDDRITTRRRNVFGEK